MTRFPLRAQQCAIVFLLAFVTAITSPLLASTAAHSSLIVLLDSSGSMKKTDPGRLRVEAFQLLLALAKDGDRLALCEFGSGARDLSSGFVDVTTASRATLAADAASCGDGDANTDVVAALLHAGDLISKLSADERRAYPPVVLFLTDGRDDVPGVRSGRDGEIAAAAKSISEAGAKIYGLGLSRDADRNLFRLLETTSGGETFYAESSTDLLEGFFALSRAIAGRWLIAEMPANGAEIAVDVPQWATGLTVAWFSTSGAASGDLVVNDVAPSMKRPLYQFVSTSASGGSRFVVRVPRGPGKLVVDAQGELLLRADLPAAVVCGLPFAATVQIMWAQGAQLGAPLFLQRATSQLHVARAGIAGVNCELYDDGGHGDKAPRDGMFGANILVSTEGATTYELKTGAPFSPALSASGSLMVLAEPVRVRTQGFVPRLIGATLGRSAVITVENLTDVPFSVSLSEDGNAAPGAAAALLKPRGAATITLVTKPGLLAVRRVPASLHIGDLNRPVWTGGIALLPAGALPGVVLAALAALGLSFTFPRRTSRGFRLGINFLKSGESEPRVEMVAVRSDGYPDFVEIPAPFDHAVRILPISGVWRKGAYLSPADGVSIEFAKRRPPLSSKGYRIKNGSSWSVRAESSRATYTFYSKR